MMIVARAFPCAVALLRCATATAAAGCGWSGAAATPPAAPPLPFLPRPRSIVRREIPDDPITVSYTRNVAARK